MINFLFTLLISSLSLASDQTPVYNTMYSQAHKLSKSELKKLKEFDFYLIPGILAESFIWQDTRSSLELSILTRDYFSPQKVEMEKLGLSVQRIKASSRSVQETQSEIIKAVIKSKSFERKVIFIGHSLGGLALIELMIEKSQLQKYVAGVIFLQSPFAGSPISNVYLNHPEELGWLNPILPFLNTSTETLEFLSTPVRLQFMQEKAQEIKSFVAHTPVITVAGTVYGSKSLFRPTADVIMKGCVESLRGVCMSGVLYEGPFDQSDGMVPLESSKLPGVDFVTLSHVDHGETIVNVPFNSLSKSRMTRSLLKMLLKKMNSQDASY